MIDAHIHCAECFREIATQIKVAGGKTKDREIHQGVTWQMVASPQGLMPIQRPVPLCDACFETIQSLAEARAAASKLIVPTLKGVPQ